MPYKDPEKTRQYNTEYKRKWRERNKERWEKYIKEWREKNRDKTNSYSKKYYWNNREKEIIRIMQYNKKRYRKQRLQVILQYGGDPPKCECCGEHRFQFLGIDHIKGNGRKHRKELKKKHQNIYEFLIKNNYPKDFRVLCHNCNSSLGYYGFCPHQVERGELTEEDLVNIEIKKSEEKKSYHK